MKVFYKFHIKNLYESFYMLYHLPKFIFDGEVLSPYGDEYGDAFGD